MSYVEPMSTLADINEATRALSLDELKQLMSTVELQIQDRQLCTRGGPRIVGLHEGMAWVADDFDSPLPDEFWLGKDA
jgi:hypothetical protein